MQLTIVSYILIPYIIYLFFKKIDFIFYNLLFFAPFTSVAIVNIGNGSSSITLFQLIAAVLFIKTILYLLNGNLRWNIKLRKSLLFFIILCALSLLVIPYKSNFMVLTPNDRYEYIRFSSQNITQLCYLLMCYLVYINTSLLLRNNKLEMRKIYKVINWAYLIIILLGFLQLIIPVNIFNMLFRNTVYVNNQILLGRVRISSANYEASILALYITPLACMYVYKFFKERKIKYLTLSLLGILTGMICNSSSFYLGIIVFMITSVFYKIVKPQKTIKFSSIVMIFIGTIILLSFFILFKDIITVGIESFVDKINGTSISGIGRSSAFINQINVFKDNILIGVGFGTSRSYDLLSTWLSQVGIIGISLYIIYIYKYIIFLSKIKGIESKMILILIFITNVILFVSVSDYGYLYFWIYYAFADEIIYKYKANKG